VVLTGIQKYEAPKSVIALAVEALNPSIGRSFTNFDPIVFMIFHPHIIVPSPIEV
jgi:hypothetical protein